MRLSARLQDAWMSPAHAESVASGFVPTSRGLVPYKSTGQGEPVVLVPGLAGGSRLLAPLARSLARSCRVIQFDLQADRDVLRMRPSTVMADEVNDLADLVQGLGLERPTVFGVSYGGALALELATQRPGLIGSLILTGVADRFESGLGSRIARWTLERYDLPPDSPFLNQFFNFLHGGIPGDEALAHFVVEQCWRTDQAVMAARLRGLETFDVSDRLWRIEVPTLVLAGSKDVVTPVARQQALAEALTEGRFALLKDAGHIGFLSARNQVRGQVRQLLRERLGAPL